MEQLSDVEIFNAALKAGFTPDQAVTMTAIALAESGGRTTALNSSGEYSVGLWQINTAVHEWDPAVAEDPYYNALMAFEVSGGGADISRWTVTHEVNGSPYLAFRQRAEAAAAEAGHPAAAGQWDPPHDYHERGVGAAPAGSTSTALYEPGEIPTAAPTGAEPDPGAPASTVETADDAASSSFDRDRDGVFDAVEAWLGEDLFPDASDVAALDHDHEHAHDAPTESVDVDDLVNGQVNAGLLADAAGGDDDLLAGAPANSWNAMVAAAAADGIEITYSDAYRSLQHQHDIAAEVGLYSQGGLAATPGTSNHGLGLAIDVNVSGHPEVKAWLNEHAHEYGWVADVPREPWHYEYREELDPDPNRWAQPSSAPEASDEGEDRSSVFDSDGDGVYDAVEAWLGNATAATPPVDPLPAADPAGAPAADPSPDPAAGGPPSVGDPMGLSPLEAGAPDDELVAILARFDLDPDGRLAVDELSSDIRTDLENALAELAASRSGIDIDPHDFSRRFDHVVAEHDGIVHVEALDELMGLVGLDLDH